MVATVRATATSGDTTNTIVIPSSVQAGDLMFMFNAYYSSTPSIPVGWSSLVVAASAGSAFPITGRLLSKIAVAGDAGSTITLTNTVNYHGNILLAFIGNPGYSSPATWNASNADTLGLISVGATLDAVNRTRHLLFACYNRSAGASTGTKNITAPDYTQLVANLPKSGESSFLSAAILDKNTPEPANTTSTVTVSIEQSGPESIITLQVTDPVTTYVGIASLRSGSPVLAITIITTATVALVSGTPVLSTSGTTYVVSPWTEEDTLSTLWVQISDS